MGERVIADLTVDELKALIAEVVDERMFKLNLSSIINGPTL